MPIMNAQSRTPHAKHKLLRRPMQSNSLVMFGFLRNKLFDKGRSRSP
jgi:hypothetical protein